MFNFEKGAETGRREALRMAVVGVGAMGRAHCRTMQEQVEEMRLVAVVDAHPATADETGGAFDVPAFTSVTALIDARVADAALVATPHPLHPAAVVACLDAGLHVLCEKPMAEAVSSADRMLDAARRAGRTLGVMFQRRFDPVFEAALAFVRGGNLGELVRTLLVLPDFRTQSYYDANAWRATWKGEGGGVLINQAPHLMDLFALFGGLPQSLTGYTATTPLHDIEVEDRAEALLRYANGAVGYLYASTTEPKRHETLELVGTRGSLTYRHGKLECLVYDEDLRRIGADSDDIWRRPEIREMTPTVATVPNNRLQGRLMANFARHILFGEPLRCDAESARMSLELANAITLSSHLKAPVQLPVNRPACDELLARLRAAGRPHKNVQTSLRVPDPRLV